MIASQKITIFHHRKAFTLLEMLIVISVCIAIVSFAIPRYQIVLERFTAKEGEQILYALLAAQKRYEMDNGSYASTLSDLDVDFPPPTNFDTIDDNSVANSDPVAQVTRTTPSIDLYILHIYTDGTVTCDTEHASVTGICQKIGY
jgi:type II secretory pathway pseudopilin PulG